MHISNLLLSSGVHYCVNAHYKFCTPKAKINRLASKTNCYIQRQSTPIRINFHFLVRALKIQKLHSNLKLKIFFSLGQIARKRFHIKNSHCKKNWATITQNRSIFWVKNLGIFIENLKIFGWVVFAQVLFLGNVNPIFFGFSLPSFVIGLSLTLPKIYCAWAQVDFAQSLLLGCVNPISLSILFPSHAIGLRLPWPNVHCWAALTH